MHPRGSTLLEALAGLALASTIAGLGVPRVVALAESAGLAGTSRVLATALRLARERALGGGVPVEVRFDVAARRWTVQVAGRVLDAQALASPVTFAAVPARQRIVFGALGTADNATVTLAAGARRRSVVVNQRGRVRFQ
jgi:Tfp pilus assembly protein FimT